MRSLNVDFVPGDEAGTIVYVARNGKYLGRIVIGDTVKKDSAAAIKELRANGVKTVMLTGRQRTNCRVRCSGSGGGRI